MPLQPGMGGYHITQSSLIEVAVYWSPQIDANGSQLVDDYGKALFNPPCQIFCKWDEKTVVFLDNKGNTQYSKAVVRVQYPVLELGVLWYGLLQNINPSGDPFDNDDAWEIRLYTEERSRWGNSVLMIATL